MTSGNSFPEIPACESRLRSRVACLHNRNVVSFNRNDKPQHNIREIVSCEQAALKQTFLDNSNRTLYQVVAYVFVQIKKRNPVALDVIVTLFQWAIIWRLQVFVIFTLDRFQESRHHITHQQIASHNSYPNRQQLQINSGISEEDFTTDLESWDHIFFKECTLFTSSGSIRKTL